LIPATADRNIATGSPLPWPAPESLLLKFAAHHLWDPAKRETNPEHGMPEDVSAVLRAQKLLRGDGPHAPATVRRRLTSWSILTHWRGLKGEFSVPSLNGTPIVGSRHRPATAMEEQKGSHR